MIYKINERLVDSLERVIPTADKVIIQPILETKIGCIELTSSQVEQKQEGIILKAGQEVNKELVPGKHVFFRRGAGAIIESESSDDRFDYILSMLGSDVLAIIV
jgi:co-chaperonin GroES (HSP10)